MVQRELVVREVASGSVSVQLFQSCAQSLCRLQKYDLTFKFWETFQVKAISYNVLGIFWIPLANNLKGKVPCLLLKFLLYCPWLLQVASGGSGGW